MNIDQKINLRMAELISMYVVTKHPELRRIIPRNCKTKARYNTCYDLIRPGVPLSEINRYINESSEKMKVYLENNISRNRYLRVEVGMTYIGQTIKSSLTNELPSDYKELERTGIVKFVETKDVELK